MSTFIKASEFPCQECGALAQSFYLNPCPVCERTLCRKCHGRKFLPIGGHNVYEVCHRCESVAGDHRDKLIRLREGVKRELKRWRSESLKLAAAPDPSQAEKLT